ncbi:ATPase, T2SS/T4P/T4SS family [Leptolyngbya sp. NIES-2104]|uniref:ATPase, T2SS/T4P/T4SS family n=1 Tax=Leptolyngbya sp. NIES-2104 TaxID=1552121 RepID=UPI0006EC644E|nr:hypothetical protein [Leptolyngbya sp. NIES-2104]GAP94752.1 type II secretory pathway, ATPase PulE/Tfp pilus assembly pathway, ATPase PilB [Leptolyngbya sp. NIES-2104]
MDTEKIFQLIDRVLPFEACLYHQILPLSIEGNTLHLGMVMLDDVAALDYARRMVGYQNYLLAPQSLSSESHHTILTTYLNYSQNRPTPPKPPKPPEPPKKPDLHSKETLVVESPDELEWEECHKPAARSLQNTIPDPHHALPALAISTRYSEEPIALLSQLPPSRLIQELLGRVLGNGIGRLFFDRQEKHGRILWSQNGVLQSVIEGVALSKFQALLDELKQLTHLPLTPVTEVQQVEIERSYQRDRVLLRLRITPSANGEQATLQVLRGAALKFYQKQQLTTLSRDALSIAQKLRQKMDELHNHTQTATPLTVDQLQPDMVPALNQVLQIVEQQLTELKQIRDSYNKEN